FAALFGPAEVMAAGPVVVTPPPITIPPGPNPRTNESLAGNEASGDESKLKPAREKPASNVFRNRGEKTWVSCALATWARNLSEDANRGSASGMRLLPSSIV